MRADILLILLNESVKSDKMRGLPSIWFFFATIKNRFNKTCARMSDSIHPLT